MSHDVFKDRTQIGIAAAPAVQAKLRRLLQSPALRPHHFARNCEIGPFVVPYLCRERSLIVELEPPFADPAKQQARTAFLSAMGYTLLQVAPQELKTRPTQVLRRIRAALH